MEKIHQSSPSALESGDGGSVQLAWKRSAIAFTVLEIRRWRSGPAHVEEISRCLHRTGNRATEVRSGSHGGEPPSPSLRWRLAGWKAI
ncbi:hypothetical protein TIFTF001_052988 [Ficus carica]|uniref:Uncharacterized protein n=1 Tax=Ficus carica TaxID=3494 RepID=A0AA88JGH1_FICCA|nr:hypothetical protein TIFTF001_052988 [Ficus carica]